GYNFCDRDFENIFCPTRFEFRDESVNGAFLHHSLDTVIIKAVEPAYRWLFHCRKCRDNLLQCCRRDIHCQEYLMPGLKNTEEQDLDFFYIASFFRICPRLLVCNYYGMRFHNLPDDLEAVFP